VDNTIQLYLDKEKEIKGYPITSPDRVIDENGVNIKDQLNNINNDIDKINNKINKLMIRQNNAVDILNTKL
jgi:hypothetical protein